MCRLTVTTATPKPALAEVARSLPEAFVLDITMPVVVVFDTLVEIKNRDCSRRAARETKEAKPAFH